MSPATEEDVPVPEFPEERLVRVFVSAARDAETDEQLVSVLSGAFHIGYRRGLLEGAPPLQPEDVEAIAHRFTVLAGRMRWLQQAGAEEAPLTFGEPDMEEKASEG